MIRFLKQGLLFLEDPRAIKAFVAWPVFSFTSYRMLSVLSRRGLKPKVIIDVGANVGQFAVAAAEVFPGARIHAFEPLPEARRKLVAATGRLPNVTIHGVALGNRRGHVRLRVNSNSVSSSVLELAQAHTTAFPDARVVAEVEVPISTLDAELTGTPLDRPALLKLDVQGYELQALEGAAVTLSRVDHVLVETSLLPLYEGETTFSGLHHFLEDRGFGFEAIVGALESPRTGELLQIDALFARDATR